MNRLDDFYIKTASDFEKLTRKIRYEVGLAIISVSALDNVHLAVGGAKLDIIEIIKSKPSRNITHFFQQELRMFANVLTSLKEMIKITLSSFGYSVKLSMLQATSEAPLCTKTCDNSVYDISLGFTETLNRCLISLEHLSERLFSTEVSLANINK